MGARPLLALRVDKKTNVRLERVSRRLDRPKSWLVRKSIDAYLDEIEDATIALDRINDPNAEYLDFDEFTRTLGHHKH